MLNRVEMMATYDHEEFADPDDPEKPEGYSESRFWDKLKRYAKAAGSEVIEKALWLYYASQRPETPVWARSVIFGALAYFILPTDAIPDLIPLVGYSDDLGALAAAIGMVSLYISDDVKEKTRRKMSEWFG
jgi:uncharacterized membrane protein YkvA (DUF1232 family)